MRTTIQNQQYAAEIDHRGAQLASLIDKSTGYEYIWQRDPAFWTDSAPNLFPIVGHLKNGTYSYGQKTYQMPKHGIVRHAPFNVTMSGNHGCRMTYVSNENSRTTYPFHFELHIDFTLTENGLQMDYHIQNRDSKPMPVGLGYHPAFAIDIQNHQHTDYEIVFNQKEQLDLYGIVDNLFGLKQKNYLNEEQVIPLTPLLFDEDALIFTNINSDAITLRRKTDDWALTVTTGGAPHLAIWAKPAAPFVCIEPWYVYLDSPAATDDLMDKPGMVALSAGAKLKRGYAILPQ